MRTSNLKNKPADPETISNGYTDTGAGCLHEDHVGHHHTPTGAESS